MSKPKDICIECGEICFGKRHRKCARGKTWEELYGVKEAEVARARKHETVMRLQASGEIHLNHIKKGSTFIERYGEARASKISGKLSESAKNTEWTRIHGASLKGKTWEETYGKNKADLIKAKKSKADKLAYAEGRKSPGSNSGKPGRRADLNNIFFRSRWEANVARILNLYNAKWEFEKHRFSVDGATYIPDFKVGNTIFEVKGWFPESKKIQFSRFKELYPQFNVVLIDYNSYIRLVTLYKSQIPNWETTGKKNAI